MSNQLPQKIDPFRSAAHKMHLQGHVLLRNMARLAPSLSSTEGQVEVDIVFGVDEQGVCTVRGDFKTHVKLQCQRCMESFDYGIINSFLSGIVHSQLDAEKLSDQYDPVVAVEGEINLQDMIEDELIVSLPIVPMHDSTECKVKLPIQAGSSVVEENNPFKVISILRSSESKK